MDEVRIYANSHYVTPKPTLTQAIERIRVELAERLGELEASGKLLERQRLEERTNFDLEMMNATGSCAGIENYSRYLTGRQPGEPPPTVFEYLPEIHSCSARVTSPPSGARDVSRGFQSQDDARQARFPAPSWSHRPEV